MSKPDSYIYILRSWALVQVVGKLLVELYSTSKSITWEVIIRPLKSKRTQQQNKYYWVIMGLIGDYLGYTKDEVHEFFKEEFLEAEESIVMDKSVKVYPSTTKLNTQEFYEYIELISRFMAEQGFAVPPPLAYGYEWRGS